MKRDEKKLMEIKAELAKGKKCNRGKVFITIRELLGYRQAHFARLIGVKPITLSRWESNEIRCPSLNFEQCRNLNYELSKINLSILDLPFITVSVKVSELKTAGMVGTALIYG